MKKFKSLIPGILLVLLTIAMLIVISGIIFAVIGKSSYVYNNLGIYIWATALVPTIALTYNDIYLEIINRYHLNPTEVWGSPIPGIIPWCISATVLAIALFITIDTTKYSKYIDKISIYEEYYDKTETLLDSLGIECDNPIFESDAGADYLQAKYNIDKLNYGNNN